MAKYYKNLVQKPKYEVRTEYEDVKGRQYPTMTYMSNDLVPGSNVYIEIGWVWAMPDPNAHIPEHCHAKSDEFVLHIGSDPKNPEDLGGEIEFVVGGETLKINKTSALYVPEGVIHGPLTWKSVTRPHIQMTIIMGAGTLAEAAPAGYKGR
ncbi:MAG: hypothetical protein ACUVTR_03440 [Dehalococcoidia bacterium]